MSRIQRDCIYIPCVCDVTALLLLFSRSLVTKHRSSSAAYAARNWPIVAISGSLMNRVYALQSAEIKKTCSDGKHNPKPHCKLKSFSQLFFQGYLLSFTALLRLFQSCQTYFLIKLLIETKVIGDGGGTIIMNTYEAEDSFFGNLTCGRLFYALSSPCKGRSAATLGFLIPDPWGTHPLFTCSEAWLAALGIWSGSRIHSPGWITQWFASSFLWFSGLCVM